MSEWKEWNGGMCPVSEDTIVDVEFREGHVCKDQLAGEWEWTHYERDGDIVKYRVVKEADEDVVEELDKGNKYKRFIKGTVVDVYDIAYAYDLDPARAHALKKILCSGQRGYKDFEKDLKEAKNSLDRSIELNTL